MSISKIKIGDATHDIVANGLTYCTCSTAADTVAKEATVVSGKFSLFTGATVVVKFTNANSIAAPTLNVGGTGAKPIYRYGTTTASTGTTTTGWVAGAVQMFTYDGTGWIRDYWNNTTYSNVSLGQGYATCSTAAATTAKVGSLSSYALTTGGIVSVKFTYAVPASATLNINSKGAKAIYYRGAAIIADVIKAGDTATFIYNGSYYHLISIDRWQNDITTLQTDLAGKLSTTGTAAKATADASGNTITSTYMTKISPTGTGALSINRKSNTTVGSNSSAVGFNVTASGSSSHAEGTSTVANGAHSHAEGYSTTTVGEYAHAEGYSESNCPTTVTYGTDNSSVIETWKTTKFALAKGKGSHTEGYNTLALGDYSHTEGSNNIASEENSHAEGEGSTASGLHSHAEGLNVVASALAAHAEGTLTIVDGQSAHAEGFQTASMGYASHAEGYGTYKIPDTITSSTANSTVIEAWQSSKFTMAKGRGSHAEGYDTLAVSTYAAHAEGGKTLASGNYSHAEGEYSTAGGLRAHAEGYQTIASSTNQHVQGRYNIEDTESKYAHIVGNGSFNTDRSNAHTLDWDGNAWFAGNVYVGGTSQDDASTVMPTSGGTFTGDVAAYNTNRDTTCLRNSEVRITSVTGTLQSTNKIIMVRK